MSTQTRPRQTTFAGGMIVVGSVFLLLTVWEMVAGLRGLESRESIENFLSEPPGSGLGLSVEGALQALRGVATVAAVCAAVAVVLGVYALRGHRPARVGLSVLALPIFLSGLVAGGFMSSVVAVAIVLLWVSPSREWFRGEPIPDRTPPEAPRAAVWPPPPQDVSGGEDGGSDGASGPAEAAGPGPGSAPVWGAGATGTRSATPHGAGAALPSPDRRPEGVTLAFVLTLVSAGLVLLLTSLSVLFMAVSPDLVMEEMQRQQPDLAEQGVTQEMLRLTTFVMGGFLMVWAVAAIVLAFLTMRRHRGAARALTVSAGASAVLCVIGTFASLLLVVPAFASIVVLAVLRRPDVRAWLAGDR